MLHLNLFLRLTSCYAVEALNKDLRIQLKYVYLTLCFRDNMLCMNISTSFCILFTNVIKIIPLFNEYSVENKHFFERLRVAFIVL